MRSAPRCRGASPRGVRRRRARAPPPGRYGRALAVLVASLGPPLGDADRETFGMAPFLHLPNVMLIEEHGLADVDASLDAQHALTQRFSCELSIRPFLEEHPERTLAALAGWTRDPSPHVRRLVSEGTRPRLPWAPRLRAIAADPAPARSAPRRSRTWPSRSSPSGSTAGRRRGCAWPGTRRAPCARRATPTPAAPRRAPSPPARPRWCRAGAPGWARGSRCDSTPRARTTPASAASRCW